MYVQTDKLSHSSPLSPGNRLASQMLYEQHYVLISLNGKEINKYQYQYQQDTGSREDL